MSFNNALENSMKLANAYIGKKKKHHIHGHNQRNRMNLHYDTDSSLFDDEVKKHRRGTNVANKKRQQVFEACADVRFNNDKRLIVYDDPVSLLHQNSISNDSDADLNTCIQFDLIEYNKNSQSSNIRGSSIDKLICSNTNDPEELAFGQTDVYQQINNTHEHITNNGVLRECCEKSPLMDTQLIGDLNKAFDNPSEGELAELVLYTQRIPYEKRSRNPPENPAIKSYRIKRGFSKHKLISHFRDIRKKYLNRCSYGFLIISKNKKQFLAVRNSHGQKCRGAPKGHMNMKPNGHWETPFEAAVREINEEIYHLDSNSRQCRRLNEKLLEDYYTYLECKLESTVSEYRLIGLFVYCLEDDFEFSPKDLKEIDDVSWFGLEENINPREFYTLYPFIEYLRNRPEVLFQSKVNSQ